MLSANSEVSVSPDMIRSTKRVPTIEMPPIKQRDRSGDDAAEDEEQQQGEDREGDQLGLGQVRAGLVVGLVEALGEAALGDVERAGVGQHLDPFGGDPAGVLDVIGREVAGDRQRLAVLGDQLGAGAGLAQWVERRGRRTGPWPLRR